MKASFYLYSHPGDRRISWPTIGLGLFFLLLAFYTQGQSYTTVGNASSDPSSPCGSGDCYRLTPNATWRSGAVWSNNQLDLTAPFYICAQLNFGGKDGSGADGIGFVLHNDPRGTGAIGGQGGFMGAGQSHPTGNPGSSITPSMMVEFDTWNNNGSNENFDDLPTDHIGINKNGDFSTTAHKTDAIPGGGNLEDGDCHQVCFRWNPDQQLFEVFVDGNLRISESIDLINDYLDGSTTATWGFTGATGAASNSQKFCIESVSTGKDCCDDLYLRTDNQPCSGAIMAGLWTSDPACGDLSINMLGFQQVYQGPGYVIGVYTLAPQTSNRYRIQLVNNEGDVICEKVEIRNCDYIIDSCDPWSVYSNVSYTTPGWEDLFVEENPYMPTPVYAIRVDGVVTVDGFGSPIAIPTSASPGALHIGSVDPATSPNPTVEFLDVGYGVICSRTLSVNGVGGGPSPRLSVDHNKKQATTTPLPEMMLMPNPSREQTTVIFYLPQSASLQWEVLSLEGKRVAATGVLKRQEGPQQIEISTEALPDGIYVLQLHTPWGTQTEKLVVQH